MQHRPTIGDERRAAQQFGRGREIGYHDHKIIRLKNEFLGIRLGCVFGLRTPIQATVDIEIAGCQDGRSPIDEVPTLKKRSRV